MRQPRAARRIRPCGRQYQLIGRLNPLSDCDSCASADLGFDFKLVDQPLAPPQPHAQSTAGAVAVAESLLDVRYPWSSLDNRRPLLLQFPMDSHACVVVHSLPTAACSSSDPRGAAVRRIDYNKSAVQIEQVDASQEQRSLTSCDSAGIPQSDTVGSSGAPPVKWHACSGYSRGKFSRPPPSLSTSIDAWCRFPSAQPKHSSLHSRGTACPRL